jgi:hypothetical protein
MEFKHEIYIWLALASVGASALLVILGGNLHDNLIISIGFYMGFISVFVAIVIRLILNRQPKNTNIQNNDGYCHDDRHIFNSDSPDYFNDPNYSFLPYNNFHDS